jgi:hypothetical protein
MFRTEFVDKNGTHILYSTQLLVVFLCCHLVTREPLDRFLSDFVLEVFARPYRLFLLFTRQHKKSWLSRTENL